MASEPSRLSSLLENMKTSRETDFSSIRKQNETGIRMCQQDVVKYDLHVKAYIQDIRDCGAQNDVLNTLNLQISDNMRKMKGAIEDLERFGFEQDLEVDRKAVQQEAAKYRKQFQANQLALRKANLACQKLIDQQNKEELFYKSNTEAPRRRTRADKESLVKQSSLITGSLVSLNNMMTTQVKQSEQTLQTLVGSSANVTDSHEELKWMGSFIKVSRKLLHKYGRREMTDKVLIGISVVFFVCCILYVVQKRLF